MKKTKIIQLKGRKGKKKEPASDAVVIGELFLLGLKFAIGINKDKFILSCHCSDCNAYHPLKASYNVSMPASNHTPIDFLTCMMPHLNHLVVEHMLDTGIVQDEEE